MFFATTYSKYITKTYVRLLEYKTRKKYYNKLLEKIDSSIIEAVKDLEDNATYLLDETEVTFLNSLKEHLESRGFTVTTQESKYYYKRLHISW